MGDVYWDFSEHRLIWDIDEPSNTTNPVIPSNATDSDDHMSCEVGMFFVKPYVGLIVMGCIGTIINV
jgi:hypothetical protein